MARIRTIKPEFWTDEKVGELKRDERLLFLGLLNLADDEGVLKATPAFIKGQIFAYDEDLTIAEVRAWLEVLSDKKMLVPFEYNGEKFFLIRTFKSHQKINRPTPSKIPLNVLESILNADSRRTHVQFSEDSLGEGKGKEGNKEGKGNGKEEIFPPLTDKIISEKIMNLFNFNEIANFDKLRDVAAFLRCIEIAGKTKYFDEQLDAYTEYKTINDSYKHKFKNFIGSSDKLYTDGAWNDENWIEILKAEQIRLTKNQTNQPVSNRGVEAAMEWGNVTRNK